MATVKGEYLGDLRTDNEHIQSGSRITTDAPIDNQGRGEAFSPTDLLATAFGDCIMTIMGINARDKKIDLKGTQYEITKVMYSDPRRVGEIHIHFSFPKLDISLKDKKILEGVAKTCPVAQSIHADIIRKVTFDW